VERALEQPRQILLLFWWGTLPIKWAVKRAISIKQAPPRDHVIAE